MPLKGIEALLPELRRERGWSRERLSHQAYGIDQEGTSVAQIAAIERGERRASARTMLALAKALEVDPEYFPEFRLAVARIALDEKEVGLGEAIRSLKKSRLEPTGITDDQIRESSGRRGTAGRGLRKARSAKKRLGGR